MAGSKIKGVTTSKGRAPGNVFVVTMRCLEQEGAQARACVALTERRFERMESLHLEAQNEAAVQEASTPGRVQIVQKEPGHLLRDSPNQGAMQATMAKSNKTT
ncbi:hypothetical protein J7T55_009895 [Diaporthe amygdali]|uniref:uncharacterized protein n=1 Tax=Phomopsis amygdali TaxID=1214568 RepID=UPI0022FDFA2D|nr:uncharacterized protein J7T55_009895 [Diaporthe amygdali]KAJ0116745.1 hypothetical protein J7T55_009895 [Diaporthe amygdali]